jgi:hypothetical protein
VSRLFIFRFPALCWRGLRCETGTAGARSSCPNPAVRYNAFQWLEQQEAVIHRDNNYGCVGIGFMDGAYMPVSEMRIPITDIGFRLGDMCYDAIRVHKGSFFRLKDHLDRWETSIGRRRYTSLGYDREQVAEVLHGCVARGNLLGTRW